MAGLENLKWTCHVCGDLRSDSKISVYTKISTIGKTDSTIEQNIRYCNDRQYCREGAKDVDFFKKK